VRNLRRARRACSIALIGFQVSFVSIGLPRLNGIFLVAAGENGWGRGRLLI
jgi:hypothetical protein